MSNHTGGGMASKERLYELWMLYYTKVSASAEEDLTLTPVVAAQVLSSTSTHTHALSHTGTFKFLNVSVRARLGRLAEFEREPRWGRSSFYLVACSCTSLAVESRL